MAITEQPTDNAMRGYKILAICAALIAIGTTLIPSSHHFSGNRVSPDIARYIEFMNTPIILLSIAAVLVFEVVRGKLTRWKLVGAGYLIGGTVSSAIHKLLTR
jgi:hypothetical protein